MARRIARGVWAMVIAVETIEGQHMRNAIAAVLGLALVGIWGCNQNEAPRGGPGAKAPPSQPSSAATADTFKLSLPSGSTHVKQGESKTATISISRGKSFTQDVKLSFDNLPQGVIVEPATATIRPGDSSETVTIKASDTAQPGESAVRVTGRPANGPASTVEMRITVDKK
jgi:hypothetical protein